MIWGAPIFGIWGGLANIIERPAFIDSYWRIPVCLFALAVGLLQNRLKNYFTFFAHLALTLFVVQMAIFLGYSGEERFMYGAFVVLLGVFIGFLNYPRAFLVHAIICSLAFVLFPMYFGVFAKFSSPIRQVIMFYGMMYYFTRINKSHMNIIEKLRTERIELLKEHSEMVTVNLKNAQSIFTALASAQSELPPSILLQSFYQPASEAGGDWIGHFYLKEKKWLVLAIGDVTGHDLASSLVTIAVAGAARGTFECLGRITGDLGNLVQQMAISSNLAVLNCGIKEKSMTAVFVGIDLATFQGVHVNCAHPSAMMLLGDGVKMLESEASLFLGDVEFEATVSHVDFSKMKSILIYTDGLIETKKMPISEVKLKKWFQGALDFYTEVSNAFKEIPLEDDVSFLLITRQDAATVIENRSQVTSSPM